MSARKLLCLLPVRNGEADLPGYFESVERFADGIIALDDGSTDRTRVMLEEHSLVIKVLTSPPRSDYVGWDDAGNRNRLLLAAAEFEPEWIMSLDADERIPADDAAALRAFVEDEALPGCAYGFEIFRMWEDMTRYDPAGLWIYRLFAFEPGQRFPDKRLHFVPIPTNIPRNRWLRTTVRVQHLGSVTEQRRQARYEKYRQADPDNEFQHTYENLLGLPPNVSTWPSRPAGLPVLDVAADELDAALEEGKQPALFEITDRPALSAVVISQNDEDRIARTLSSIVNQECSWPFEVIVVTSGTDRTAEIVRTQFPNVQLIELDHPALPGEARNAGLRIARGEYITFPGSHIELTPGSFEARLRAHDLGYAMVTGSTLNGTKTRAGWASYFLDHSGMLPGRPSAEYPTSPPHCSYRRSALLSLGGFPENMRAGEDTVVNNELTRRGFKTYWDRDVRFIHHNRCRTPKRLGAHHFVRGRAFGRILREQGHARGRAVIGRPALRLYRRQVPQRAELIRSNVHKWANDPVIEREYRRAAPLIRLGAAAAWLGTIFELLRPLRLVSPIAAGGLTSPDEPLHEAPVAWRHSDASSDADNAILPKRRILAYYGYPGSSAMGVLGEHDMPELLTMLQQHTHTYEQADPQRPVLPALELIAVMAQKDPGRSGTHRARTPDSVLESYVRFTEAHGILLVLDVQPALSPLLDEVSALEKWLRYSHVHLAIDPEWILSEGQVPGDTVGCVDAGVITQVQHLMGALSTKYGLPPKVLIVHQFLDSMIRNKSSLGPVPGVQLVIDADGFGGPNGKRNVYYDLITRSPVEFAGIKLFFKQDNPLMTAEEILALRPSPDVIIYQ